MSYNSSRCAHNNALYKRSNKTEVVMGCNLGFVVFYATEENVALKKDSCGLFGDVLLLRQQAYIQKRLALWWSRQDYRQRQVGAPGVQQGQWQWCCTQWTWPQQAGKWCWACGSWGTAGQDAHIIPVCQNWALPYDEGHGVWQKLIRHLPYENWTPAAL